jgi:hypothetical protein
MRLTTTSHDTETVSLRTDHSPAVTPRRCRRLLITLAVAAALMATGATAGAQQADVEESTSSRAPMVQYSTDPELIFELRGQSFYTRDASFHALSDDQLHGGGHLSAGIDLGAWTVPGLRGHLVYMGGGVDRSRFDDLVEFDWRRDVFMVAADWGPELWGVFRPSVRLGAGYAMQNLDVNSGGSTLEDRTHDLAALGAVGLEFYTRRGYLGAARIGFIGNFGYMAQTAATFDELEADSDDDFERQPVNFGALNTNGLFWDIGLGLRWAL